MQLRTSYDNSPIDSATELRKQRIWFMALALGLGLGIMVTSNQQKQEQPSIQDYTQASTNMLTRIEARVPQNYPN